MQFSVIYSVDVPRSSGQSVASYAPPCRRAWQLTETDDDMGSEPENKHRKWCAVLSREQFDKFVRKCGLRMSTVETMGMIGAPGFGFGWAPAHSFDGEDDEVYQNAYVCPIPEVDLQQDDPEKGQRRWGKIKAVMLRIYG